MRNMNSNWKVICSLVFSLLALIGCKSSNKEAEPEPESIPSDHVTLGDRHYKLTLPSESANPNKVYKLILAFHPSGGKANSMQATTRFETLSDDYIVAYPQSEVEEWEEGCQCNKPYRLNIDDLSYVDNVISDIKSKYNIFEDEIYAVGFSQGALFTQNLLCNRSEVFNGIASVGAPMSLQLSQSCSVSTPTDYMMVHGTSDSVLPYKGMEHSNFALIGSEQAISLIATLNQINTDKVEYDLSDNVRVHEFKNEQTTNKLIEIKNGGHSWEFEGYNTSEEVLKFFDSVSNRSLPDNSYLLRANENNYHVRTMGENSQRPEIVLLSGLNYNYHSDSAWFSLLQPILSKQYKVHVIDRLGNGYSDYSEETSYEMFAKELPEVLNALTGESVLIVSFASSNISTKLLIDNESEESGVAIKGLVWVDPDILTEDSISFYQEYPVSLYRERLDDILEIIEADAWTERSAGKMDLEREEIAALIGDQNKELMDWTFFDNISQRRLLISHQKTRAIEIANYHNDLELARGFTFASDVPISSIDSDFELKDIAYAESEGNTEYVQELERWMAEGTQWSKSISESSGGVYRAIEDADHMVMFEHPAVIVEVIEQTLALGQ